jgi:serine/threonine protein kinase
MIEDESTATAATEPTEVARAADDLLGDALIGDRYRIERRLGAGGMGVVYEAHDLELERQVAVKVVRARADSTEGRARLAREARAMARLRHPNVVTLYDIITIGDRLFVVMELVERGTLAEWLKAARRTWREVVDVFLQAARGLAAAHAAGFVHRDFKPENVLIGKDGGARVSDFGVARLIGEPEPDADPASPENAATGTLVGTAGYIAPEILRRQAVDARADQFSFCVALYAALYGRRPFGAAVRDVGETLGSPHPPLRGMTPGWLGRIILRGLASEPRDRWPSVTALIAAIGHGLRRRGRLLVLLSAALAVAGTAVAAAAMRRAPSVRPDWSPVVLGHDSPESGDVSISRDGATLVYSKADSIVIEPREGSERRRVSLPAGIGEVIWVHLSLTGEHAFVLVEDKGRGHSIWSVGVPDGKAERVVPSGLSPSLRVGDAKFDVGPGDRLLVILDEADRPLSRVVEMSRSGTARSLLEAKPGSTFDAPAWSPDGSRALVLEGNSLDIVDMATGRVTVTAGARYAVCDWLTHRSVLCSVVRDNAGKLVELTLSANGELAHTHERLTLAPYTISKSLRTTDAGILYSSWSRREQLKSLDLEHPGPMRLIESDSASVLPPAGWMSDGSLVFGASVAGHARIMARRPDGRVDVVRSDPGAEVPLVVLGDAIIFARFSTEESISLAAYGRHYPAEGGLFRLEPGGRIDSLGPTHDLLALRCAGDRAPPCLLMERVGDDGAHALEWRPETGARGREVARWSLSERGAQALAPDGHSLAQVQFQFGGGSGDIEIVDASGGATKRLALATYFFRSLSWDNDGTLVASGRDVTTGFGIARLRADSQPETLVATGTEFPLELRVRPDGKEIVASVTEFSFTYHWVAGSREHLATPE